MRIPVYAMYDKITHKYGYPIAFESDELAFASVRRTTRDLFSRGEISLDALKDNEFCALDFYEDSTGEFVTREERIVIKCDELVTDIG